MEGFPDEEELWFVALRADAVQLWQGFFSEEQRVDVATAREDDAVECVEQRKQCRLVVMRGNDYRCAASLDD